MDVLPTKFEATYDSDDSAWANNDLFNRKEFAESLTNLVVGINEPLVIGLYAKWGEGKTAFVKMWERYLTEIENVPTIYIDAFENDYMEDPFLCLTGEVYSYAKQRLGNEATILKSIAKKGGRIGKIIAKSAINIGLRAATAGTVNSEDFKDISTAYSASFDELMHQEISTYAEQKKELASFKKQLTNVACKLGNDQKPLVIIIDELDRCRPSYALEMLERIKHLFNVDKVIFVLVLNLEQMESMVERVYGDTVDATDYLHKFIDIPVSLPMNLKKEDKLNFALNTFSNVFLKYDEQSHKEWAASICQNLQLSLRKIQRISTLTRCSNLAANNKPGYHTLIAFILSLIKVENTKLYEQVCKNENVSEEINKILKKSDESINIEEYYLNELRILFDEKLKRSYSLGIPNLNISDEQRTVNHICGIFNVESNKQVLQRYLNWINFAD